MNVAVPPVDQSNLRVSEMIVPRCLYGSSRSTKRAWQDIATAVWDAGAWGQVVSSLEMVHILDIPGPIIYSRGGEWSTNNHYLRLDWIQQISFSTPVERNARWQRLQDVVFDGMKYLWFTVGISGQSFGGLNFTNASVYLSDSREYNAHSRDNLFIPWLQRFIDWTPEFASIIPRLCIAYSRDNTVETYNSPPITLWHVAHSAGLLHDLSMIASKSTEELQTSFDDLINYLERSGAIVHSCGRYQLDLSRLVQKRGEINGDGRQ